MIRKQTKLWKCKDGKQIRICDMTDQHLKNTVKMLDRAFIKYITGLENLAMTFQGEMALMTIESDIDRLWNSDASEIYPIYENLIADLERRGIYEL